MKLRRLAGMLALPVAATVAAQAPPRRPTFEVAIDVTNLTLSVTDNRGRFVTGLTNGDFAIYEDGIRQDLSYFTHEDLPISLSLLMDTSASMDNKLARAQAAAIRFTKTLRDQDDASIQEFNTRAPVGLPFTADRSALEAAILKTTARGSTALHNALYVALKELANLKQAGQLRRRAIVLLSDGEDTASLVTDEQVIGLARKAEIGIFAVFLRDEGVSDAVRSSFSQARFLLTTLTRDSGGELFTPTSISELDTVYDRISEELRTQYHMGYVSSNPRRDGKWRRVVVRVPSRENLRIRHKVGYFGPSS